MSMTLNPGNPMPQIHNPCKIYCQRKETKSTNIHVLKNYLHYSINRSSRCTYWGALFGFTTRSWTAFAGFITVTLVSFWRTSWSLRTFARFGTKVSGIRRSRWRVTDGRSIRRRSRRGIRWFNSITNNFCRTCWDRRHWRQSRRLGWSGP